jgi:serine protease Do
MAIVHRRSEEGIGGEVRLKFAALVVLVLALSGCSFQLSVGLGKEMSKDELERSITDSLEREAGRRPDAVECPSGIKAEVGESIRCVLTDGQDRFGLTATVTEVNGERAGLDIQVDTAPAVSTPPPAVAPSERATATVHPALVRVLGRFVGVVHDRQGAYANGGRPYRFTISCTGFGVHPDGYLASAGHCVDANDPTIREAFIRAAAEEAVAGRTDVTLEQMITHGTSAWAIEGPSPGSPIQSEIRVSGIPGAPPEGFLARVVDDRPIGQGDVALLKVDGANVAAVEFASDTGIGVGTPVLAAGYPESLGALVGPDAQPSIAVGAVVRPGVDGGRPIYEIDAALEHGVSGGPVVDANGRVFGINSVRTGGSIVIPIGAFADLLGRNGVTAEVGPRDRLYREALDAYDAGEYDDALRALERLSRDGPVHPRIDKLRVDAQAARDAYGDASENRGAQILMWTGVVAAAIAVVAIGVVLVVRRRRRRYPPFPGPPAGPPWQGGPSGPFPPPAQRPTAPGQLHYSRPAGPHE